MGWTKCLIMFGGLLKTFFVSLKKVSIYTRYGHFCKIWRHKVWFYPFNFFYRVNVSVLLFLVMVCYSFWSVYALCHVLCAILANHKQSGNCFLICVCSLLYALSEFNKSKEKIKLSFFRNTNRDLTSLLLSFGNFFFFYCFICSCVKVFCTQKQGFLG
jgi:hypothetical protein